MRNKLQAACILIAVLLSFTASAQLVTRIQPSLIDSRTIVRASIPVIGNCRYRIETIVSAPDVTTNIIFESCAAFPQISRVVDVEFGPLAPGTYRYRVVELVAGAPPDVIHDQLLAVTPAPAPVPALDSIGALTLLLGMVGAALFRSSIH